MESSRTRAQTRVPCIGRQILNHCATREAHFSLLLINIPCYECTTVCFTINTLKNILVISSLRLLWIKLLWTLIYRFLCEYKLSFPWNKCPRMKLLDCIIVTCLVLYEITTLFSRAGVLFYVPTSSVGVIQFLYIIIRTWCYHCILFVNIFQVFSFHFVAIGKALMPKNACVFGRAGSCLPCWWEHKIIHLLWKIVW